MHKAINIDPTYERNWANGYDFIVAMSNKMHTEILMFITLVIKKL